MLVITCILIDISCDFRFGNSKNVSFIFDIRIKLKSLGELLLKSMDHRGKKECVYCVIFVKQFEKHKNIEEEPRAHAPLVE